ncbi:MAG: NfeD family protein [Clostridia bacterium]
MSEFVTLFTGMSVFAGVFLGIGLILVMLELFIPGFGVFGIGGFLCMIVGTVARTIEHGLSATEIVLYITYIILIYVFVIGIIVSILVLSAKYGALAKTSLFENKTTLPVTDKKKLREQNKMIGKKGIAVTDLKPCGKVDIDGEVIDVISTKKYIYYGTSVVITDICDETYHVEKA